MKKIPPKKLHTYGSWEFFFSAAPTAPNSPELQFHFYKFFYPTISGRISGVNIVDCTKFVWSSMLNCPRDLNVSIKWKFWKGIHIKKCWNYIHQRTLNKLKRKYPKGIYYLTSRIIVYDVMKINEIMCAFGLKSIQFTVRGTLKLC